jgi:hypothetical protein
MNPSLSNLRRQSGSVLLLMLVLSGVLVLTLGGYFWWVRGQNLLVARSQSWNAALALAEAGVEEGLAQANVDFGTNYLASIRANWGAPSAGVYGPVTRSFSNSSYSVVLMPTNPGPLIIATGLVSGSVLSRPLIRTVQVTTKPSFAFSKVITTRENLTFNLKQVPAPNTAGWLNGLPPAQSGTFTLAAPFNYLVNDDLTLAQDQTLAVAGSGVVSLYVTGNFITQGTNQPSITIAPGATLLLYVGATAGQPVSTLLLNVSNAGGATNFQYYGLPNNTNFIWSGSTGFTGTVYAPQAAVTLSPQNATGPLDVRGAFVANSLLTNGLFNFYYDPNLSSNGPVSGFTVNSWHEL